MEKGGMNPKISSSTLNQLMKYYVKLNFGYLSCHSNEPE